MPLYRKSLYNKLTHDIYCTMFVEDYELQFHSNITSTLLFYKVILPYTAKLSRGKTFAVVHKTHHSLENFRGASGPCHYVLYTANDSRGKLRDWLKKPRKPRKFSPSKVLPYTVCVVMQQRSVRLSQ